jgi:hypothetical protein
MQDMVDRGRANPRLKLSEEQIIKIRWVCHEGHSQRYIASLFGISDSSVSKIVRGEMFPDVGGPLKRGPFRFKQREDQIAWVGLDEIVSELTEGCAS